MTQAVPINLIRWHYLWDVAAALAITIAAIATHYLWFLNLIQYSAACCGRGSTCLWASVLGPILPVVDFPPRKSVLLRSHATHPFPNADASHQFWHNGLLSR